LWKERGSVGVPGASKKLSISRLQKAENSSWRERSQLFTGWLIETIILGISFLTSDAILLSVSETLNWIPAAAA
jgi:hypothetical protein